MTARTGAVGRARRPRPYREPTALWTGDQEPTTTKVVVPAEVPWRVIAEVPGAGEVLLALRDRLEAVGR